jgi:hypothetical protein
MAPFASEGKGAFACSAGGHRMGSAVRIAYAAINIVAGLTIILFGFRVVRENKRLEFQNSALRVAAVK